MCYYYVTKRYGISWNCQYLNHSLIHLAFVRADLQPWWKISYGTLTFSRNGTSNTHKTNKQTKKQTNIKTTENLKWKNKQTNNNKTYKKQKSITWRWKPTSFFLFRISKRVFIHDSTIEMFFIWWMLEYHKRHVEWDFPHQIQMILRYRESTVPLKSIQNISL